MKFYAYRLMIRENQENYLLKYGKLFHQYAVDMYVKIESERLAYLRFNQSKLRSEAYIHLRDALNNDGNVRNVGQLTILPGTFTGSPRHMHEYTQDALVYVRNYGKPDLFITFTCNPNWAEIKENLYHGQKPEDRHDITARVFKQKLKSMIDLITKHSIFGKVRCWMYSVEWQKRGLPHAHVLIWLIDKITPDQIDNVISAEIPDENTDPLLYEIVIKNMIHGPCGALNMNCVCMSNGKCSKRYPRQLISETITGDDGYPLYRRRAPNDNGHTTTKTVSNAEIEIDNSWVVPYSPILCKTFNAHINVEYCNSVKSIKYICKYVNKGSDMAVFGIAENNDEIKQFQMGRYVSTNEAIWRILSFHIHERYPTVIHLAVHLENGQRVYFTEQTALQRAETPPSTTLTEYFKLCSTDIFAKTLLYHEIPKYYTWNASAKKFARRKQGTPVVGYADIYASDALGRIYTVHPNNIECFYLRLLLINVRGPTSFENIRAVDGVVHTTYRDACNALQLLENDQQWINTVADATISSTPSAIRTLFAIIITTCTPANPTELWEKFKDAMTEDILNTIRTTLRNQEIQYTPEMYNETLIKLEDICLLIANKSLLQLGITAPNRPMHDIFNMDIHRERSYNRNDLNNFVLENIPKLQIEQKRAYDNIMHSVNNETGFMFFLDAPGGTGKTFLLRLILATVRRDNKIALALASSGIAATLLDGGRTAHSALKLPLNIHTIDTPVCRISRSSGMGKLLLDCKLIVWDECTMAHKLSLEALDRTLQDLRRNDRLFGGIVVLLSGDFRQTLPVMARSTPADELNACLKSSILWRHINKLTLKTNMRVSLQNDPSAAIFAQQLLEIGNGTMQRNNDGAISLPTNFYTLVNSTQELIHKVFPNIQQNYLNKRWIAERAILAPKNKDVHGINIEIQSHLPTETKTYLSTNTVIEEDQVVHYPTEFLNSLEIPGMPPHDLTLKVGAPIIMLRNINQPKLCNGTRLIITKLMNNVIEATIIVGKFEGETVLIPRIPIISTDTPFQFKRLQFPIRLAYAMTINKSQGQSLNVCGINLEHQCFSHGQLYVACSRVGKPSSLFIYTPEGIAKNIVYNRALI